MPLNKVLIILLKIQGISSYFLYGLTDRFIIFYTTATCNRIKEFTRAEINQLLRIKQNHRFIIG